jgi:hypothetical protein
MASIEGNTLGLVIFGFGRSPQPPNGTKKRRKACVTSLRVFRLGMYSKRAAAFFQATGGGASENGLRAWRLGTS